MVYRIEKDTMGEIKVPFEKLWGAQTQRSYENFKIGREKMPIEIIKAFAVLKKSAALINSKLGLIEDEVAMEIAIACDEVFFGKHDNEFPLVVWQTGSGTQSNMNVNEVIANIVNKKNSVRKVHPNDDINKGQSSNDTFPTAMHIAAVIEIENRLIPAMNLLEDTLDNLSTKYMNIVKIGRTHLQDAVPLTLGQEISGWNYMIKNSKLMIKNSLYFLREIALGATAVGTGLNTHKDFADLVAKEISRELNFDFVSATNKFHSLTSKDALVNAHGALKALAVNLHKIANDIRLLASGPRCGIGELFIPENEPGSSIMPGKVNPTQCEAITMISAQVLGNDVAIGFGASQGHFELNVYMPVIIFNFLQSVRLLADGICSFNNNCVVGIKPNIEKIQFNLENSLMLVTSLNPHIGYENAAKIAKYAYQNGISLKEAAIKLSILTEEEFDDYVKPEKMI